MSCCCTHIDYYNPCICGAAVSTTSTSTTTTTTCNGEPCEEAVDPRCIIYNGPDIPCYGIKDGDSAADILEIIIDLFACITTTTAAPTTSTTIAPTTTTSTAVPTTTSTTTSSTTTTTVAPTTTSTTSTTTSSTTTTTTTEPPLVLRANWYSMQETPDFIIGNIMLTGCLDDYADITLRVSSVIINGTELLPATSTYLLDQTNLQIVSAVNNVKYGCTPGTTGWTYSNFVTFLNSVFTTLGLTNYKAQTSFVSKYAAGQTRQNSDAGFYIIFPSTDTFTIEMFSDRGSPIRHKYTENNLLEQIGLSYFPIDTTSYYQYIGNITPIVGGNVIE
jgi:hypothetical protein